MQLEVGYVLRNLKEHWELALEVADAGRVTLPEEQQKQVNLPAFRQWIIQGSGLVPEGKDPVWKWRPVVNGKEVRQCACNVMRVFDASMVIVYHYNPY